MTSEVQKELLKEIGGGCRDEEDLIKGSQYTEEATLAALHRLERREKLNSKTTAGHTSYAKPGNEPWKDKMEASR